jgi:hypothetical protein
MVDGAVLQSSIAPSFRSTDYRLPNRRQSALPRQRRSHLSPVLSHFLWLNFVRYTNALTAGVLPVI